MKSSITKELPIIKDDNIFYQHINPIKRSSGLILVLTGFTGGYAIATLASMREASLQITYLIFSFSFFVALSGIVSISMEALMFGSTSSVANASDLEMAVTQLGKNYDILRQQTTQGFILAISVYSSF
jgi:hypothetical protein